VRAQLEREAIVQLPCTPLQLRSPLAEVSVGLCRHEIGKYARGSIDFLCHPLFVGIAPTRHPVDPEKSNRALGFPALVTGLCQSYRVSVPPSKVVSS